MEINKIDFIKIKRNQPILFNSLREIINYHNPMNFGHLIEDSDEYDPEVAEILTSIKPNMNLKEIHVLVFEIFKKWFHPINLEKKDFLSLASNILIWLNQNKSSLIN